MTKNLYFPNKSQSPPGGGWRYFIEQTGAMLTATTEGALITSIQKHLAANDLPPLEDPSRAIEQYICEQVPGYCGLLDGTPVMTTKKTLKRTFHEIVTGTKTLGQWLLNGAKRVEIDEANRRASICAGCQENISPEGCTSCNMSVLKRLVEQVVPGSVVTQYNDQLKSCNVCGCALKAKVVIDGDIIRDNLPSDIYKQLPSHCWVKNDE